MESSSGPLDDDSGGGFGNALLARVPVTAVQQWRVYTPAAGYDGSEPSEPRSLILARLELNGTLIWLGSTHFPRADAPARRLAARRLQRLTAGMDEPWLICGDFNAPPASCFGENTRVGCHPTRSSPPTRPVILPRRSITAFPLLGAPCRQLCSRPRDLTTSPS